MCQGNKQQYGFLPFNIEWRGKAVPVQLERDNQDQNFVKHSFLYQWEILKLDLSFVFMLCPLTYLAWTESLGISV